MNVATITPVNSCGDQRNAARRAVARPPVVARWSHLKARAEAVRVAAAAKVREALLLVVPLKPLDLERRAPNLTRASERASACARVTTTTTTTTTDDDDDDDDDDGDGDDEDDDDDDDDDDDADDHDDDDDDDDGDDEDGMTGCTGSARQPSSSRLSVFPLLDPRTTFPLMCGAPSRRQKRARASEGGVGAVGRELQRTCIM